MLITASSSKDIYSIEGAGGILLLDEDEVDVVGFLQNPDYVRVYDSGMFDEEDDTTLPNVAGPMASLDKNTNSYKTTADDDNGDVIKRRQNLLNMKSIEQTQFQILVKQSAAITLLSPKDRDIFRYFPLLLILCSTHC